MQVDDDAQTRVLAQILLHGRARAAVRTRIARVVVDRPVVQHLKSRVRERVGEHVAHVHYIIIGVLGAAGVARGIEVVSRRGEGFARVCVHDENLRLAAGSTVAGPCCSRAATLTGMSVSFLTVSPPAMLVATMGSRRLLRSGRFPRRRPQWGRGSPPVRVRRR